MTVPATQQQKVTYAATTQLQPSIKNQFFTTSIAQAGKPTGAQQIQVDTRIFLLRYSNLLAFSHWVLYRAIIQRCEEC